MLVDEIGLKHVVCVFLKLFSLKTANVDKCKCHLVYLFVLENTLYRSP